ncbi:MAG: CapA family protein [Thermaerobacterales bacterium]
MSRRVRYFYVLVLAVSIVAALWAVQASNWAPDTGVRTPDASHAGRLGAAARLTASLDGAGAALRPPGDGLTARLTAVPKIERITITSVGDLLIHGGLIRAAQREAGYDFGPMFEHVAPQLRRGQISIANLEVTLAGPERGFAGYPLFNSPDELLDAARDHGITVLTTANNHAMDTGATGLQRTLKTVRERGLPAVGTRLSADEPPYLIIEAAGFKVALLAYTYGTNGNPVPEEYMVDLIDKDRMTADLAAARRHGPDLVLVALHWGQEYRRHYSPEQRQLAEFLHAQGVDGILGAHPHVVQPFELLGTGADLTPVFYSTGNFVSNQRWRYSDGGIIAHLTYRKVTHPDGTSYTELEQVEHFPIWVHLDRPGGQVRYRVLPALPGAAEQFQLGSEDRRLLEQSYGDTLEILGPLEIYRRPVTPLAPLVAEPVSHQLLR